MVTHAMANDTIRQREDRLRTIFKQYFPDPQKREIYFWDDEDLSAFDPGVRERLKRSTNRAAYTIDFFFSRFDNIEIMTMEFFYGLATHYAQPMVSSLLYGPDFKGKEMPFIGAASYLSYQGYIWSLAFMMAAKHGFTYKDIYDDIYVYAYHRLFGWAFHEYDDIFRDRLDRADLYEELTRWDSRLISERMRRYNHPNASDEDKRMCQEILENAKQYPFMGDDKMGTFINLFGYFPPHARKPIYIRYIVPTYDKDSDTRSAYRKALEEELRHSIRDLMIHIFKANITPDMSRFKFTTLDKERQAVVVSDTIKEATDEQVYAELAVVLAYCNSPVPSPDEIRSNFPPVFFSVREQTTEEKEETNNADS